MSVYHYVHDALGSVVALLDAGDPNASPEPIPPKVVERYTYDPYGRTVVESDPGGTGFQPVNASSFGNPFAWTGQRYDAGVGLYHFLYRTFSPEFGRWFQRDPAGYVDGPSLYEYVGGAALVLLDRLGLASWWEILMGVGDAADAAREQAERNAEMARERGMDEVAEQAEALAQEDFAGEAAKEVLDGVQTGLDVVGLIPVAGELADAANVLICVGRGDMAGAALSAAAMIPIGGMAATAGKWAQRAVRYSDEAAALARRGEHVAEETYEILDGVRRAKAAEKAGKSTISAEIDVGGRTVEMAELPIESLRSPKSAIDTSGPELAEKWADTLDKAVRGQSPPPIRVTPGDRGIPIRDVKVRLPLDP